MTGWVVEAGIGETRAAEIEDGRIVAARIEPDGAARIGDVVAVRLVERLAGGLGVVRIDGAAPNDPGGVLSPVPPALEEGRALPAQVTRLAIPERASPKRIRLTPSELPVGTRGPDLATRLAARPAIGDAFEDAGWSECLEEAVSGEIAFAGGRLIIEPTRAMTVVDVDGWLPAAPLAVAAARAVAAALHRFDIGGPVVVDFPTVAGKAERMAIATAFDAGLRGVAERTAVNGYGLMQIIVPRLRPSLPELLRADPVGAAARALLRQAERSRIVGATRLVGPPPLTARLGAHPEWLAELAVRLGGAAGLRTDPALAMSAAYVERA